MIKVTVTKEQSGRIHSFEMSGHAQFAEHGKDLVCAGASAVSFGAVNAVSELCKLTLDIEQSGERGYLFVALPTNCSAHQKQRAQLIFEAMVVSLQTIEREYHKFIKIKRK